MAEPRKKVLFVITKGVFGGAQRYVFDLATRLPTETFNCVAAFGEGGELERRLLERGVRTIRIPELGRDVSPLRDLKSFFALVRLVRAERPDILHLNSSKAGALGALAGRVANLVAKYAKGGRQTKVVFTAHGWASNEERGSLSKKVITALHWLTIMLCHEVIAVSERSKADVADLPGIRDRIRVVHNGIEQAQYENRSTVRTLIAPNIHQGVWIGTISELHKNKGLDFAIRAFAETAKKYPHVAFVVIGGGGTATGSGEKDSLRALADELGVGDRVHFLGWIPDAHRLVRAFDIFTLTSRTEALPYVVLEAGQAGVAVVASRVGGIPEIISTRYNGILVGPGHVEGIRDALEFLIEHPEKREQFGKRLASRIEKRFSVARMVAETAKIYQS